LLFGSETGLWAELLLGRAVDAFAVDGDGEDDSMVFAGQR
jgi:hypothetical protein